MTSFADPSPPTTACFTVFVVAITETHVDLDKVRSEGAFLKEYLEAAGYPWPTMVISSTEEVSETSLRFFEQGLEHSFPVEEVFQDPWFDIMHSFGWRPLIQQFFISWLFKHWLVFAHRQQVDRIVFFCHHHFLMRLVRETIIQKGWWMRYMDKSPGGIVGLFTRLNRMNSGEMVTIDFEYDPFTSSMGISSVTLLSGTSQKCY